MDDFNPYLPPRSQPQPAARSELPTFYVAAHGLYGGLLGLGTLILVLNFPQSLLDGRTPSVALILYAPLLSFLVQRRGSSKLLRLSFILYGVLVLWLIKLFFENASSATPDLGMGSVLLGVNCLSLGSGLYFSRHKLLSRNSL